MIARRVKPREGFWISAGLGDVTAVRKYFDGKTCAVLNAIEGSGGMREVRWVIHAPNAMKVGMSVRSTFAGSFDTEIKLK